MREHGSMPPDPYPIWGDKKVNAMDSAQEQSIGEGRDLKSSDVDDDADCTDVSAVEKVVENLFNDGDGSEQMKSA